MVARTIRLLHPFSAQAIGLKPTDLYYYHSKPHENALRSIGDSTGYHIRIDYFTGRFLPYTKTIANIKKCFWPITYPILRQRHGWRKQHSQIHYLATSMQPPDLTIINMSGHGSPYVFKLAKLLVRQSKPYIAMIGGMNLDYHSNTVLYYKNAQCIIVHTQLQKQALQKTDVFRNLNIYVLPLGVDTNLFKPLRFNSNTNQLLYVGRISRLKQLEKSIESLHHIVNVKGESATLNIIGPISDPAYLGELKTLIHSFKLEKFVTFLGSLSQTDLIPYYQRATILLLPSKHESFGMVMVEAMACGTPVVALKGSGGPDEIVVDGVTGKLCVPASFNDTVYNLLNSPETVATLAKNSVMLVQEKWSLTYTTQCLKEIIASAFN
ncbi:glycosyltransferase family 4 protein [Hanstruepera ponticola]|uniref:glycosyltransferase family 4 protein n=1 Tax=Hanstruepera ponticola TaxID=2042995 RepID=UPI0017803E9F|nr:glycosyltransferase family 4 protein [Hanstruepera ponticola]